MCIEDSLRINKNKVGIDVRIRNGNAESIVCSN